MLTLANYEQLGGYCLTGLDKKEGIHALHILPNVSHNQHTAV